MMSPADNGPGTVTRNVVFAEPSGVTAVGAPDVADNTWKAPGVTVPGVTAWLNVTVNDVPPAAAVIVAVGVVIEAAVMALANTVSGMTAVPPMACTNTMVGLLAV